MQAAAPLLRGGDASESSGPQPSEVAAVSRVSRWLQQLPSDDGRPGTRRCVLAVGCCCLMAVGGLLGVMLLGRLYYNNGGTQIWLYTLLQSLGCPLLFPPLLLSYWRAWVDQNPGVPFRWRHLRSAGGAVPSSLFLFLLLIFASLGLLSTVCYFLFAIGVSYLPISTDALLTSSQLGFNAVFAFFLVRHGFTAASLNAVVIITLGAVLLGLRAADASTERPSGVTQSEYILGFASAIAAAALFSLIFALLELTYKKFIRKATFCVVLEFQIAIAMFATLFSLCGMAINHEFAALSQEAYSIFDGAGPVVYSLLLLAIAVSCQIYFLGSTGLIFIVSSLFSNLVTTASYPLVALIAIPAFGDSFNSLKVIALFLAVWGLISYVYDGYTHQSSNHDYDEDR